MAGGLGHIAGTVSLDINPFEQSSRVLERQIKSNQQAIRALETSTKGAGNSINGMRAVYAGYNSQLQANQAKLSQSRTKYEELKASIGDVNKATDEQKIKLANAASAVNKDTAALEQTRVKMNALSKEIAVQSSHWTQSGQKMIAFGNQAKSMGSVLTSVGTAATFGMTAPIVAGLGMAAKKAVEFQNTMNTTKNLLITGGESAKAAISGVKTMTADATKYSDHYGKSTQSIAEGYQNLVKRGYTSKQAIGAMRTELEGSVASGDDFNDVVSVASQTLEAFGMKSNTTAGMTRNTKKAVNELAYAADLTSTDFHSLGVGMSYVGATAHQAGFSLSETSAAMGLLSNNGLEADKAGTGLRKVINSLVSPSQSGADALGKLGLKTSDFVSKSGKMKSMTDIFGLLNTHMKGMSDSAKMDIFHALFGTTGQQAGAILANNADQLGKLNDKVKASVSQNYVGNLAEKNLQSAKNQIEIFKQSVINLGMTMANTLLPAITPIIHAANNMLQSFENMSAGSKRTAAALLLTAAAVGPVLITIGKLSTGIGAVATAFGNLNKFIGSKAKFVEVGAGAEEASGKLGKLGAASTEVGSAVEKSSGGFTIFGKSLTTAEAGAGVLGTSLTPLAVGIGVAAAAAVAGAAIWELWGKKAYESARSTARWGSDVGVAADNSLEKMRGFVNSSQVSLDQLKTTGSGSASTLKKQFSDAFSQMQSDSKRTLSDMRADMKNLPDDAKAEAEKTYAAKKSSNNKLLAEDQKYTDNVNKILSNASKDHRKLTSDEAVYVKNAQQKLADDEVSILNVSSSKRRAIEKALSGDVNTIRKGDQKAALEGVQSLMGAEQKSYEQTKKSLDSSHKAGLISSATYYDDLNKLNKDHNAKTKQYLTAEAQLWKQQGMSIDQINQALSSYGVTYQSLMKKNAAAAQKASKEQSTLVDTTQKMSKYGKNAAKDWNNLIFDPKTGKVATNAREKVIEAGKDFDTWNQMEWLLKHANLNTNAKNMIGDAALANDQWDTMTWKERDAVIVSKGGKDLTHMLEDAKKFKGLSLEQKEAIINAKKDDLLGALRDAGVWNTLTLKQQEAVMKDSASPVMKDVNMSVQRWNTLSPAVQNVVAHATGKGDVDASTLSIETWNSIPTDIKQAMIYSKGGEDLEANLTKLGQWDGLSVDIKQAIVNSKGGPELVTALGKLDEWKNLTPDQKNLVVNDNASAWAKAAGMSVQDWNELPQSIKNLVANDYASGQADAAKISLTGWNRLTPKEQKLVVQDLASGKTQQALQILSAYNGTNPNFKSFLGDATNANNAAQSAKNNVNETNATNPNFKNYRGDASNHNAAAQSTRNEVNITNATNPTTKNYTGNDSQHHTVTGSVRSDVSLTNGINPNTKNYKGDPSGAINASAEARRAISVWNSFKPIVHEFKSVYTKVERLIKGKATGTDYFGGGPVMVNDQVGPRYKEAIQFPGEEPFIPEGRNVVLNAPLGTKIWNATQTSKMFGDLAHMATGNMSNAKAIKTFNNLAPEMTSVNVQSTDGFNSDSNNELANLISDLREDMNDMLQKIYEKSSDVIMNSQKVGEQVAPTVDKAIDRFKAYKGRTVGRRS